jgi:hypothetical protein
MAVRDPNGQLNLVTWHRRAWSCLEQTETMTLEEMLASLCHRKNSAMGLVSSELLRVRYLSSGIEALGIKLVALGESALTMTN